MNVERPARILHIGLNTAGDPVGLSRGERALGFESDVLVFEQHPFGYPADIDLDVNDVGRARSTYRRWAAVRKALSYDVIHFEYGYTLIHRLRQGGGGLRTEIPLLKRMGKTILASFMGDDARPPSANPWGLDDPDYLEFQRLIQPARRELMLTNADRTFYVNPDLRHWLPGAGFRPYASVDPLAIEPQPLPGGDKVVVVHAPSHRGIKGTEDVIAAVDSLRADGIPVEPRPGRGPLARRGARPLRPGGHRRRPAEHRLVRRLLGRDDGAGPSRALPDHRGRAGRQPLRLRAAHRSHQRRDAARGPPSPVRGPGAPPETRCGFSPLRRSPP